MRNSARFRLPMAIAIGLATQICHADHIAGGFGLGQSSAILTESAIPMAEGDWYLSLTHDMVENKDFTDDTLIGLRAFDIVDHGEAAADLHSIESISSTSLTVGYGLSSNLTVGLRIPYVTRKNIREPEEGHSHGGAPIVIHNVIEHGDSSGIGDVTLAGQYRFLAGAHFDLSLLFGLKVRTGETQQQGFVDEVFVRRVDTGVVPDEHDHEDGHTHEGTTLETHQQPGSGSNDPLIGFAYSRVMGPVNLDSSVLYTFANDGSQNTNLGDSLQYNLAVTFPANAVIDLVLEANGEWHDQEIRGHQVIENSGGQHLYITPGIRYAGGDGWSASVSYGFSVSNDYNGYQSQPDHRLVGKLSFTF